MPPRVKICGISTPEALHAAVAGGASHIGFVFFSKSPRNVALDQARSLAENLPSHVTSVALVVDTNHEFLNEIVNLVPRLGAIQFHGKETPEQLSLWRGQSFEVWKAIAVPEVPIGCSTMPSPPKALTCPAARDNDLTGRYCVITARHSLGFSLAGSMHGMLRKRVR